jgi:FAD:protein FMN transferase
MVRTASRMTGRKPSERDRPPSDRTASSAEEGEQGTGTALRLDSVDAELPRCLRIVHPVAAASPKRSAEPSNVGADPTGRPGGHEEDHLCPGGRVDGLVQRPGALRLRAGRSRAATGRRLLWNASVLTPTRKGVVRRAFRAMGTGVELIAAATADEAALAVAFSGIQEVFLAADERFSRFRGSSELSRVNAGAGGWVPVSGPFAALTRRALRAAVETQGLFDPTVLPALAAAGYDRDFAEVRARAERGEPEDTELREIRRNFEVLMLKNATACGAWSEVEVDGHRVRVPGGAALDFGGIAKGWTVDRATELLGTLPWAIVDAGGDLRVVGQPPEDGLQVAIEDPDDADLEVVRLELSDGALATTSVTVRSWGPGLHQVIDPRTSLPAATGVEQATVWAPTCTDAEVWSKAALLAGPAILDRIPAALVMASGDVLTSFADAPPDASQEVVA